MDRYTRSLSLAVVAVTLLVPPVSSQVAAEPGALTYPETRTVDVADRFGATVVADPYRWLEDLNAPETAAWVAAQNAVTNAYLATLPMRDIFRSRITELWNYPKVSAPRWEGGRWHYSRNSGLQRQSVRYARTTLGGPEQVVLDPNKLSPDGSVALSGFVPSPDGRYVAYGQSEGGSDWSTYHVRDLRTGRATGDTVRWVKFSGLSWTHDGRGFFYGRYPEPSAGEQLRGALRDKKIYYHAIGTTQAEDRLIYERPDEPTLFLGAGLDETGRYLLVTTNKGSGAKNELYVADLGNAKRPDLSAAITPLFTGHDASYRPLGIVDGVLYLLTDRDAPRRRIVAAPLATPRVDRWRTVVPQGKNTIEDADLIGGRLVVETLEDVAGSIRFYRLSGTPQEVVQLPGLGSVGGVSGRFDRPELFYTFTSPLVPATVYRYDAATKRSIGFEPPRLTFDPSRYVTTRVFYPSKDGTKVPMFITHRRGMALDGANPTMLYAYGGFDITTNPSFRPDGPAWLERGGVWASANLRGGGEYGEAWHEAGMKEKKQNVFDDFIAAAEWLQSTGRAARGQVAIEGGHSLEATRFGKAEAFTPDRGLADACLAENQDGATDAAPNAKRMNDVNAACHGDPDSSDGSMPSSSRVIVSSADWLFCITPAANARACCSSTPRD